MFRLRTTCKAFILSDFCAFCASLFLAYVIRSSFGGQLFALHYLQLMPLFLFFFMIYWAFGLYPGILKPHHEELKWLSIGTSIGFLSLSFLLFLGQQGVSYSRVVITLCWIFCLIFLPLFRFLARKLFSGKNWWGYPVLLFAHESTMSDVENKFLEQREKGLNIAGKIVISDASYVTFLPGAVSRKSNGSTSFSAHLDVKNYKDTEEFFSNLQRNYQNSAAVIATDGIPDDMQRPLIILAGNYFHKVLVRAEMVWIGSLQVADIPLGLSLSLRQNLLDPYRMIMKRFLDILLCILGSVALVAVIPVLALCIRLDSDGPVFFRQKRIGQDGKDIYIVKFRTMVVDAEKVLAEILESDPAQKEAWGKDQKMMNDPRLTRVGAFLRRTSLDELPQVFNVLTGEMSLVGPRPIVESEISRYGEAYSLYKRVKPGITGLWQISGRNDVAYSKRVELDQHYVYNWSVWLDIYIIICTIPAILRGKGAY